MKLYERVAINRKKKWIPMLVILSLCLFAFGMVLGLKNGMDALITDFTYKTMECDKYEFRIDRTQLINIETANWLETEKKIKKSMIYATDCLDLTVPDNIVRMPEVVVMDDSDTFEGRYTLEMGVYPKKGEVLLSPNAAIELFGTTECIGNEEFMEKDRLCGEDLLCGKLPEKDTEIVIDGLLARRILVEKGILENESEMISEEALEQLLGMEFKLRYQNAFLEQVVIVGIAKGKKGFITGAVYVNRRISSEELKFLSSCAIVYLNDVSEDTLKELDNKAMRYGAIL